ncbi:MAG: type II TA system antitoxin MqsA family protein [Desulfobacteraceae bacterium]
MKCPECGSDMILKTIDETLELDGQSLTLHGMSGHFCEECDEGVWDEASYRRYVKGQEALVRSAKENVGTDIRRIRTKLNLTQKDFADRLGLGKLAFSRYETGKTRPPAFFIKFLKVIERHPDLLDEIQ